MKILIISIFLLGSYLFFSSLLFAFNEPPVGCQNSQLTCVEKGETRYIEGIPVYQNCWKYELKYTCPDWDHYTNTCADDLNCTQEGDPIIIDPWKKQLKMVCKETVVKYECTAYKENKYCDNSSYTHEYEKFQTTPVNNFNIALSAFGKLDALQKSIAAGPLKVFKGEAHICEKPLNMGSLTTDCCDAKLHTHGGNWSINQCTNDDIKLAQAQRAHRSHYIGSWCKEHMPWPLDNVCIDKHKSYCTFNSILDRLIEEEGRKQLANLALHGGKHTQEENFSWPYSLSVSQWNRATVNGVEIATYSWQGMNKDTVSLRITTEDWINVYPGKEGTITLPNGKRVSINGNCSPDDCNFKVNVSDASGTKTSDLNFPLSCLDNNQYKIKVNNVDIGPTCLKAEEIIAVCRKGSGCGELPPQPENDKEKTYPDWMISSLALNESDYVFLSPSIAAKGNCRDNLCKWQFVSIGPNGYGTSLKSSVSWNLYSADTKEGAVDPGFSDRVVLQTATNITLKPYLFAPDTDVSSGFQLQYRLPNSTWQIYSSLIPLTVLESAPIILNTQPLVKFYGSCDATTGNCNYSLVSDVEVKAKPWGTPKHPNCDGFTPEEMMLIDFSKMDLSEWTKTFDVNMDSKKQTELTKVATESVNNFYETMNQNQTINAPPSNTSQNVVLTVMPKEGQGPFDVTLVATAYWPSYIPYGLCDYPANGTQNVSVKALTIDWGDGSSNSLTSNQICMQSIQGTRYNSSNACTYSMPVFKLNHHYQEPPNHTVTESVAAKFSVGNETHTAKFNVINYWDTPTDDTTDGGGATSSHSNSNPIHPNQMPGSGNYDPNEIPGGPKSKN